MANFQIILFGWNMCSLVGWLLFVCSCFERDPSVTSMLTLVFCCCRRRSFACFILIVFILLAF